ncbi:MULTISPECIES: phage integrase central domain-containing protein [Paenibacillus]|uniref:phage integrase central domain-containing protein n=1 Tax=Paenibacillus TaxID=44249 RepID=UPI000A932420|nr:MULTISPECIES: hypothetical protein [Paenibacillus]
MPCRQATREGKQTSFSDAAQEWLADYSRTEVKSSSIRLRTKTLKVLEKHISKINIDQVTHRQYKKILNDLFDEGYSKSYLKSIHVCANMIFEWAILNNLRDDNPCKGAKIPQRVQTVDDIENSLITEKFLEKNEIQEFLAEVRKRGLYGDLEAFYLLIYSAFVW